MAKNARVAYYTMLIDLLGNQVQASPCASSPILNNIAINEHAPHVISKHAGVTSLVSPNPTRPWNSPPSSTND
jgi:hypothetical protein